MTWPTELMGYDYDGYDLEPIPSEAGLLTDISRAPVVVNGRNTVTNPISGTPRPASPKQSLPPRCGIPETQARRPSRRCCAAATAAASMNRGMNLKCNGRKVCPQLQSARARAAISVTLLRAVRVPTLGIRRTSVQAVSLFACETPRARAAKAEAGFLCSGFQVHPLPR